MVESSHEVAAERFEAAARAIVAGVERHGVDYVTTRVGEIADAWGRLSAGDRAVLDDEAGKAAVVATMRVVAELENLFSRPAAEQHTTPLAVVRTIGREPTAVLIRAEIAPIERDAFVERAFPDDRYGLAPPDLGALGDPDLGPLLLVWGMAKARLMRGD